MYVIPAWTRMLFAVFLIQVLVCSPATVNAQSLLSDPEWLMQSDFQPGKSADLSNNLSDIIFAADLARFEVWPEPPDNSTTQLPRDSAMPVEAVPKPLLLESEAPIRDPFQLSFAVPDDNTSAKSVSPGFPDMQDVAGESEPHAMREEPVIATDFPGIDTVQSRLATDPELAKQHFEQIEHQLLFEDRARLKIQVLYHLGKFALAEDVSRAFLEELSLSPWAPEVYYYFLLSLQRQEKKLERNSLIEQLSLSALAPVTQGRLLRLLSEDSLSRGLLQEAIRFRLKELSNPETASGADPEGILEILEQIREVNALQMLREEFYGLTLVHVHFPRRELKLLVAEQRFREARVLLEALLERAHAVNDEEEIEELKNLRRRISVTLNVNPYRIGVILPLGSTHPKVSKLVQQTLEGLRLALASIPVVTDNQSLDSEKTKKDASKPEFELVLRDSMLNPEETRKALRELVEEERVIAIIGPLTRKTSEAAAFEAQHWNVPMISLSLTASIPEIGNYIFRNNQNWKLEVEFLVRYAMEYFQARRFVILHAMTREGSEKTRLFQQAVEKLGGIVVASEGFSANQQSFIHEFDAFTGKLRLLTREEAETLSALEEKEEPVRNFDAVFIAVGAEGMKDLRVIFPYASVYQMKKMVFLGDSGWNHPALPFAPRYRAIRRLVFTDDIVRDGLNPLSEQLFSQHERLMYRHQNYTGPSSYTAYAYETLLMLIALLREENHHSHRDLRIALDEMEDFPGVSGRLSFNEKGEIQRDMRLLTLKKGRMVLLN